MPAIDRPSGVPLPHACSANRLCATSSGSSSCIAISSRITSRSASTSSPVSSELVIMSPSTSIASGRSLSSTRAWKQVYSLAVNALNSPPTASRAIEMSSADRSPVPLKSRCSRKCEQPCSVAVSSREPTPTHTPMLAERTPASCSVTIRRPLGRTVRRTSEVTRPPPSRTDCRVRVETRFSVRPRLTRTRRRRAPRRPRRPGPATACRGRRSRRSRPGSSGRPRRRPRRPRPACRRRADAAC